MKLLSRVQASLLGVMIGDAMGMPWEIYSAQQIKDLTDGQGVTGFTSPVHRKLKDTEKLEIGSTTDDWQLTEAIAESLIRRKDFDLLDVALLHVEAFENSVAGWGGTTRNGLAEIKMYFDWRGAEGRSPFQPAQYNPALAKTVNGIVISGGGGNGIAMKIAPIGLFLGAKLATHDTRLEYSLPTDNIFFDITETAKWVQAVGQLTHPDPSAIMAGFAVASIITELFVFDLFNKNDADAGRSKYLSQWLITRTVHKLQALEDGSLEDKFSDRLKVLLDMDLLFGDLEVLRKKVGMGCLAKESVVFAIALFLRNPQNFRDGILEAINSGGDTDTIAAITGSMIGSVVGLEGIPEDWRTFSPEFEQAIKLGKELYDAALGT